MRRPCSRAFWQSRLRWTRRAALAARWLIRIPRRSDHRAAAVPNPQRFDPSLPNSLFLNQNYLNPATFFPLAFQPFGYPQAKNFVYAYSQQANLTFEQDLGHDYAVSLAYNFNGGRHLNRPINANTMRGDLLVQNWQAAVAAGAAAPTAHSAGFADCGVSLRFPGAVP